MPLVDRAIVLNADGELVADGPPREVIHGHGDWLAEAGVWTPQVSELAHRLERDGLIAGPVPADRSREAVGGAAPVGLDLHPLANGRRWSRRVAVPGTSGVQARGATIVGRPRGSRATSQGAGT